MPTTEQLVEASRGGDSESFAVLVRRYERTVTLTAWSIVDDFHIAEDIAQDSFVIAFRKLHQLRENKNFGPWILNITKREALHVADRRTCHRDLQQMDVAAPSQVDWVEGFSDVVGLLAQLPDQERIVVALRYLDGLSVREVAEAINRPVGTVTKQISRALQRIRELALEIEK